MLRKFHDVYYLSAFSQLVSSGSALMDGAFSKYPNAFSVMLPGISGAGYLHRLQPDTGSAVSGIKDFMISVDGAPS